MGFMDELKKLARPYAEDEDDFDDSNAIDTVTQCSKSPMGL